MSRAIINEASSGNGKSATARALTIGFVIMILTGLFIKIVLL
jgi:hypothetical protein